MSDTKKAPIDLIPLRALIGAARVLEYGNSRKDGRQPGDFIDRPLDGVFYASTMRHTMELQRLQGGVTLETLAARDADSNLPVIDHIITNLLILRTLAIRDGVLPEDPAAHTVIIERDPAGDLVWKHEGKTVKLTNAAWSSMSAELAPEVLDEPEPLPPAPHHRVVSNCFDRCSVRIMPWDPTKPMVMENCLVQPTDGKPTVDTSPAPQPGSGPVSCGIVDCRACTKAEELSEDVPTNRFEIGAARTEGMRW